MCVRFVFPKVGRFSVYNPTEAVREYLNVSSILASTAVIVYQTIRTGIFDELGFSTKSYIRL